MVEESKDSRDSEQELGNFEKNIENLVELQPSATRKIALRDLQNVQRNKDPDSTGNSVFPKDGTSIVVATKVESGAKRPRSEGPVSPSCDRSPTGNATNGHLVYVRRKLEGEAGKNSSSDHVNLATDSPSKTQIKEAIASCSEEVKPLPMAAMSSSPKPSVSLSLGVSGMQTTQLESSSDRLDWEERYHQLQMLLKKLNESDLKDCVQMLRSLSSFDLSRHAVELEKRSIQLSLEEAKEMQRVPALNVLGRPINRFKAPSSTKEQPRTD